MKITRWLPRSFPLLSMIFSLALAWLCFATSAHAQNIPAASNSSTTVSTRHPALFLVGDSITVTGSAAAERGPEGFGWELMPLFDPAKIHVYNVGAGGRSSRGYIQEGLWAKNLARMEKGDFMIIMFAHNDEKDSTNYPDRRTVKGSGDETQEIESPVTHQKEIIHTYGYYMKQYVGDAKAKGVTVVLLSPTPRNQWADGKIKRGFDGYAQWAAEAAKASGALFVDLNTIAADHYDALGGQQKVASYFADTQHPTKLGAKLIAASIVEGVKKLPDPSLANMLIPTKDSAIPTTAPSTTQAAAAFLPPIIFAADVGLPSLYIVGDSTAADSGAKSPNIQGWGTPFLTYFDTTKINVVNAAKGGRSSRTYIGEGWLDALSAKLRPGDMVLLQWGHNDPYPLNDTNGRGSLFGLGEEIQDIVRPGTNKPETLHTFGWYMRKQIAACQARGAHVIVLSLTVRDRWINGKIEREPSQAAPTKTPDERSKDPTRYSVWSADIAKTAGLPFLDVHNSIADRYEKEGVDIVSTYYNSAGDPTHRNTKGAGVDAEITLACLKAFKGPAFDEFLNDKGKAVPAADAKYIFLNTLGATKPSETQRSETRP